MKKILMTGYLLLIVYLTGEILWRRWVWNQAPVQVPWPLVYSLVLFNLVFIGFWIYKGLGSKTNSGTSEK